MRETNQDNITRIYTKRIAYELRKRHFKIIGTEPNYKKPELDVYLFRSSEALNKALEELSKKNKDKESKEKDRKDKKR